MGWTGMYFKGDVKKFAKYLVEFEFQNEVLKILDYALVGNHLWTKEEYKADVSITLYLLAKDGNSWAYKGMGECAGPYYDCPAKLFKGLTKPLNEYAERWRKEVLEYREKKAKMDKIKRMIKKAVIQINVRKLLYGF